MGKSAKKLAKALGVALSVKAVIDFGKASAEAFMEDQKQAAKLAKVVDNLGLGFANTQISKFIDDLTLASGVADGELRPAFQALITTTGSLANSQKLLTQAIDISRGSGIALTEVAQDLANAYVGKTKGLAKYNLGLTKAELQTASFTSIMEKLNKQFGGSSEAYLATYAGKMEVLTNAAGEAQETIGGALIQSLMDFTGAVDAADLATKIKGWSNAIADFIDNFTWAFKKLWFATSDRALLEMLNPFSNYVKKGLAKIDAERAATEWRRAMEGALGFDPTNNAVTGYKRDEAARVAAEKAAAKRARELAALTKKNTEEAKKQAALKKASTIFDMNQIQIIAALKGQITEEERKRLELQLAIEQGNVDKAKELTKELAIAQGLGVKIANDLASLPDAKNPFASWDAYLTKIADKARAIANMGGGASVVSGLTGSEDIPHGNVPVTPISSISSGGTSIGFGAGGNIVVNVAGNVATENDIVDGILLGIQKRSLSGSPSVIGRIQGMFAG